jgi:hypothetical protein
VAAIARGDRRAAQCGEEVEESQVKQVLEEKDALAARLTRSPDLLDALLMTFTFLQ